MFAKGCRKLGNGKPAAKGQGCSPDQFKQQQAQRRGWVINPATGLRVAV